LLIFYFRKSELLHTEGDPIETDIINARYTINHKGAIRRVKFMGA